MTGEVKIISRTSRKVRGKYYARVRYTIDDSKPLDIMRQVENKSAIKPKQAEIEVELQQHGPAQLVAGKVTFRQLAQYAKDNIYVAAVYDDQETKITGVRSVGVSAAHRNLSLWLVISCLGLQFGRMNLLCPRLTSATSSHRLSTTVASRQSCRPPRVMRSHLHAYARRIYSQAFRTGIGL